MVEVFIDDHYVGERRGGSSRDRVPDVLSTPLEGACRVRELLEDHVHNLSTNSAFNFLYSEDNFTAQISRVRGRHYFLRELIAQPYHEFLEVTVGISAKVFKIRIQIVNIGVVRAWIRTLF